MKKNYIMLLAMLFSMVSAYAQDSGVGNTSTSTNELITFTMLHNSGSYSGEQAENLFDGDSSTKWCTVFTSKQEGETTNGAYVIFKASLPFVPTRYTMTTANDTQGSGRNWKQWQLYGMNADKDEDVKRVSENWVPLDKKYNIGSDQLPDANFASAEFSLSEVNTTPYMYFKIEIDDTFGSTYCMQMADFLLDGIISIIPFTDANVKTICVSNWDTDGDGELTMEEVAAVTNLGELFKNNNSITSFRELQFFTGLTTINDDAFNGCSSLTSVTLPKTVTSIGNHAFDGCSSLTAITLPEGVTSIGDYAFNGCSGITSITFPDNLTSIGKSAFGGWTDLTTIILPESVISIGEDAFNGCSGLISVKVKNPTPVAIAQNTFSNRTNAILVVPSGSKAEYLAADYWKEFKEIIAMDDVISFADANVKSICVSRWDTDADGELSYEEAAAIKSIGSAFQNNTSITSFDEFQYFIGTTTIGNYAFYGCSSLSSITIPNSVTTIGYRAFSDCSSLSSITIPETVTSVHNEAFDSWTPSITWDSSSKTVSITANKCAAIYYSLDGSDPTVNSTLYTEPIEINRNLVIKAIAVIPAQCTSNIASYTISDVDSKFYARDYGLYFRLVDNTTENVLEVANGDNYTGEITIPSSVEYDEITYSVTRIGNNAFSNSPITSVVLPNTIETIGQSAFYNCNKLTSINFPDNVRIIEDNAFYNCRMLSQIDLPGSVVQIGNRVFYYCSSIKNLQLPESLTDLGTEVFKGCSSLSSIIIPSTITTIPSSLLAETGLVSIELPSSVKTICYSAFSSCSQLASVKIPEGVVKIENYAFSYCNSLTSLVLPSTLTNIEYNAFYNCTSLTTVTLPTNLSTMGYSVFENCTSLTNVYCLAATPPAMPNGNAFKGVTSQAALFVNADVVDTYKKTNYWAEFLEISSFEQTPCAQPTFIFANYELTISSLTQGATIYYTRNNTDPTTESQRYDGPIPFTQNDTVRAIAVCDGYANSVISVFKKKDFKVAAPESTISEDHVVTLTCPDIPNDIEGFPETRFYYTVNRNSWQSNYNESEWKLYEGPIQLIGANWVHVIAKRDGWIDSDQQNFDYYNGYVKEDITFTIDNIKYTHDGKSFIDEEVSVSGHSFEGKDGTIDIVIPEQVTNEGISYTVTSIANRAFSELHATRSVKLPSSIKTIGQEAFYDNYYLEEFEFNEGLETIGHHAFGYNYRLHTIYLPTTLKTIGSIAFNLCGQYSSEDDQVIIIPANVTSIGNGAFQNCSKVTNVFCYATNLPETKDGNPFNGTADHATLYVPASSLSKYQEADYWKDFSNIQGFENLACEPPTFIYSDYKLTMNCRTDGATIYYTRDNTDPTSESLRYDGPISLLQNDTIRAIAVLQGHDNSIIREFRKNDFKVSAPEATISEDNVVTLTCPDIRNDIEGFPETQLYYNVNYSSWSWNYNNSEWQIYEGPIQLTGAAWVHVKAKREGWIDSDQKDYDYYNGYAQDDMAFTIDNIKYTHDGKSYINEVWVSGYTFENGEETVDIVIPEQVTNEGVSYIVTNIGNNAFNNCTSLLSITIPNSVTAIGNWAFSNCTNLSSVTIPSSVTSIGDWAFYNCKNLNDVKVFVKDYSAFCNNNIVRAIDYPIQLMDSVGNEIKEYIIPDTVTTIGEYAFRNCKGLTSITIPSSVKSIGYYAFGSCDSIRVVKSEILKPFEVSAFNWWTNNAVLVVPKGSRADYKNVSGWNFAFTFEEDETIYDMEQTDEQGIRYTLKKTEDDSIYYSVTGHTDELKSEIVIPADLGGCPVKVIEWGVFNNCNDLTSLTIPSSLTTIDGWNFNNCSNLNDVKVVVKDYSAFCNNNIVRALNYPIQLIDSEGTEIKEYIIPDSVTTIGEYAFRNCKGLTSIIIPNIVTTIGNNAFEKCSGLSSVTIPSSVTSIGYYAFGGCDSIKVVTSGILKPFEVSAFNWWTNNAVLIVPKGLRADYKSVSGWNFAFIYEEDEAIYDRNQTDEQGICYTLKKTEDDSIYYSVTGHTDELKSEIVIPADLDGCPVKVIEWGVFNNCSDLTSLTIPSSLTTIEGGNFNDCSNLNDVKVVVKDYSAFSNNNILRALNCPIQLMDSEGKEITEYIIPDSVTTIGEYAFRNCKGLTSVTIPNSVTSIGYNAFQNCSGLTSITIPSSVTTIESWAFDNCKNLNDVKVVVKDYSAFCNNNIVRALNYPIQLIDNEGKEIMEYIIPDSVTTISEYAFRNCKGLTSIAIPSSVTSIGYYAFGGCDSIRVVSSEILKPFEVDVFNWWPNNAVLIVPKGSRADYKSVRGWNNFAFIYEEDESIYDREQADEQGLYYALKQAEDGSFYYSVKGHSEDLNEDIVIPTDIDGCLVRAIEGGVFNNCSDLTSITIPSSMTTIDSWNFRNCSNLNDMKVVVVDYSEFCNNTILRALDYPIQLIDSVGDEIMEYIIPDSVTAIGDYAFRNCKGLTSITIPNNVTSIGNNAFDGCEGLTSIKIANTVSSIGNSAFANCKNLTSVKMGKNVKSIGEYAFSRCEGLTSITLPDELGCISNGTFQSTPLTSVSIPVSVKTIGDNAFSDCHSLSSVNWAEGITSIGNRAFGNCALASITIPNSVTSIGAYAFSSNDDLTTAILGDGITEIADRTFIYCRNLTSVIIPDGVTSIGEQAFRDCYKLASVKLPESLTTMKDGAFMYCGQLKSIELPNSFTVIPDNLFSNNEFLYVKLGNKVKSIGKNAFKFIKEENVTPVIEIGTATPPKIEETSFSNEEFLSDFTVIVPDATAETRYRKAAVWKEMTFSNLNNIAEVTVETPGELSKALVSQCGMMPAKVVGLKVNGTINEKDFKDQILTNMKSLLRLDLSDCNITEIPDNALIGKAQLQELTLPTSLQTIGRNAFRGLTYLTGELDLPSTVTSIGESAFVGTNYTSVKLPSALQTIGNEAFYYLPIKQKLTLPGKVTSVGAYAFAGTQINGLVIPDGMKTIGEYAFAETPIQGHVTIPDGVTTLGNGAFRNTQISTVFLPNSITTLSYGLFQGCQNLNIVYVPDNITVMSNYAFDGCGSLTTLRLSANTTLLGEYAFQSTPLEYLKVPSEVRTLSRGVLKNCKNLESLTLPGNLKTLESEALTGCTALRNMSVEAIVPPVIKDRSSIRGINTDKCLISIPTDSYWDYVLAEYWGQFVQMRNDIAVETVGSGEIAFESADEDEDEEDVSESREYGRRSAKRASSSDLEENTRTFANNGSSIYVPKNGKVRFFITPKGGEKLISATLDGEDITPYIVDGVYTATAYKKNTKLNVKFSGAIIPGDVNKDEHVDVADLTGVVRFILEDADEGLVFKAADLDESGIVEVNDYSALVNQILSQDALTNSVRERRIAALSDSFVDMSYNEEGELLVSLTKNRRFTAMQFDLTLPSGVSLMEDGVNSESNQHGCWVMNRADDSYRVICSSLSNAELKEGVVLRLRLDTKRDLQGVFTINNIVLADVKAKRYESSPVEISVDSQTGIEIAGETNTTVSVRGRTMVLTSSCDQTIQIVSINGVTVAEVKLTSGEEMPIQLPTGIYIVDGKKIVIK